MKKVAYVDPQKPGIVRFYGGDEFDGVLAGTRAQMIVDALNAEVPSSSRPTHPHLPIWLRHTGSHWTVSIELPNKMWVEVIKGSDGGPCSHVVEPHGIQTAIEAAMKRGGKAYAGEDDIGDDDAGEDTNVNDSYAR